VKISVKDVILILTAAGTVFGGMHFKFEYIQADNQEKVGKMVFQLMKDCKKGGE